MFLLRVGRATMAFDDVALRIAGDFCGHTGTASSECVYTGMPFSDLAQDPILSNMDLSSFLLCEVTNGILELTVHFPSLFISTVLVASQSSGDQIHLQNLKLTCFSKKKKMHICCNMQFQQM